MLKWVFMMSKLILVVLNLVSIELFFKIHLFVL